MKRKAKPKRKIKKHHGLHLAAKIHAGFTILSLLAYVAFGVFLGPEYVFHDLQDKYKAMAATAGTTLTLRMIGPPGKPVLTLAPGCSGTNPFINLDWEATSDTDSYDIYRDGNVLISDITNTYYKDSNVQEETAYTYYIIANGQAGSTLSDEVTDTTGDCLPAATCQITTFNNESLSSYTGTPDITSVTPSFSGTTNIISAAISLTLTNSPTIIGSTTANANGYWSWTSPQELSYGAHTFTVTATDPLDSTRVAQDSLVFTVSEESSEHKKEKESHKKTEKTTENIPAVVSPPQTPTPPPVENPPALIPQKPIFDGLLSVKITNENKTVYSGKDLQILVSLTNLDKRLEKERASFSYQLVNSEGKTIYEEKENRLLSDSLSFSKNIKTPQAYPGNYKVRVLVPLEKYNLYLSADDSFQLAEIPLFRFGNKFITYSDIVNYLGWAMISLLLILLAYLGLLILEHRLSNMAAFHITEEYLEKKGIIRKRKEVLK